MELKEQLRKKFLNLKKITRNLSFSIENEMIINNIKLIIDANLERKINLGNKHDIVDKTRVIGLYWPMEKEVDVMKLAAKVSGKIALPKIKGTKMYYVEYDFNSKMEKSPFSKLMQPQNENKIETDIIVIPGLSLSIKGDRLGYGQGHYDKYINEKNSKKKIMKIGICFHEYLSEYLPRESHDLRLDYVVTDKIIIEL